MMYLDSKGLIVQSSGDGGDTLQREGFWYEGVFLNTAFPSISEMTPYKEALSYLFVSGGLVRSFKLPYNDPTDTSRDQLVSNIRACGYYDYKDALRFILKGVLKNWSRFPNNDIAFINDYGRFIRSYKAWYLYPLLPLLDAPLIINSIIRCIKGRNFDDVGDDVNHIGDLAQAQNIYPTITSFIARKIYKYFRPRGPQYALDWYFRMESGGNPEFAELWRPILKGF